ncbi:MAG: DUF2497 domain-containing protein [Hyphomonadaceae bacterium]|nr:DUF2497 domain-containing protein [Hyphomonadaceae bacterium]
MPQPQLQPEPSMEEILASIRRIISEEESSEPAPEVLDLTQQAEPQQSAEDLLVFDAPAPQPPAPRAAAPAPQAPPPYAQPMAAAPAPAPVPQAAETIVARATAAAASGALTKLASALRIAESPGQTVEGVVRELLKPMLKEWLDENLRTIVEAQVEAELERVARMARYGSSG